MNDAQHKFVEQLALRIPKLFEAIRLGNIKSEYIIGLRRIGQRDVRLKLVAEVVDPGPNPMASHGTRQSEMTPNAIAHCQGATAADMPDEASARQRPRRR